MQLHGLDTEETVFFYEQDFYVLSNFSSFRLNWKGVDFDTSEHAYHWEKFYLVPGAWTQDGTVCDLIRRTRSAHEAFKLAENMRSLRRPDWEAVKVSIMTDILRAKMSQHPYVRQKLLESGDRLLVENSWRDDYWGWGPNRDGKNVLGRLWMSIRSELRKKGETK